MISGNIFRNSHPEASEPRYGEIRSVSEIGGRAHAVGLRGMVYRLEGDELCEVDFGNDVPETTYHLSAIEDVMWSIGRTDVMAYDGETWIRIV